MEDKVYSFLGLAQKAGKLHSGEFACEKLIAKGSTRLVIVTEDASVNTKKRFKNKCTFYNTKLVLFGEKSRLGSALGKDIRAVVVVTEEGFARRLEELIQTIQK